MDQPGLDAAEHARALRGLTRINSVSGSAGILWPSLRGLARQGWTDEKILAHGFISFDALYAQLKGSRS